MRGGNSNSNCAVRRVCSLCRRPSCVCLLARLCVCWLGFVRFFVQVVWLFGGGRRHLLACMLATPRFPPLCSSTLETDVAVRGRIAFGARRPTSPADPHDNDRWLLLRLLPLSRSLSQRPRNNTVWCGCGQLDGCCWFWRSRRSFCRLSAGQVTLTWCDALCVCRRPLTRS